MFRRITLAVVFALTAATASADERELIEFLQKELSDLREYVESREAAPVRGRFFRSGKTYYQSNIDGLLDQAIDLVAPDTFDTWAEQIREIDAAVAEAETRRADLVLQKIQASASKGVGMVGSLLGREYERGSIEDINQKLVQFDAVLAQLDEDRELTAMGFARDMRELHGVNLTREQAKALLYPVNGGLMVESAVVLQTLGVVERQISEVMREDIGSDARRTYFGIASATRLIYARLLQQHLAAERL